MRIVSRWLLALSLAPLSMAQSQFSTDVLALNPLGYWPLHGNAADSSTNHVDGTGMNGLAFAASVGPLAVGPAAVFASAHQTFVQMPSDGSAVFNLGTSHPLTVIAWVRTENQVLGFMTIAGKFDVGAGVGWGLGIDNGGLGGPNFGGRLGFVFFGGGNPVLDVESAVSVADGGWHLVAVTYDGGGAASGVHLYADGVELPVAVVANSVGGTSIVNSAPLTIGATTDGDNRFEGNINEVAVFGTALTAAQNMQLANDAPGFRRILPQFVFGGGWYSAVYFYSSIPHPVSFPVTFVANDGTPLVIPAISGSSTTVTLHPGAATVIEAPNAGDRQEGYVSVVLPVGVNAYGVFRQSVPGVADQEAVVPLAPALANLQSLLYDETQFITGVAIVNPSSVATTVTIVCFDVDGHQTATGTVDLPPNSKTTAALRNIAGLAGIAGTRGTAMFTVPQQTTSTPTGYVSVLGLRFKGLAFTSIPANGRPGI